MSQVEAHLFHIDKVAIIGVGAVGATTAYAMLQAGSASEIVLVDLDRRRAEGEMMDLQHCLPFTEHAKLSVADLDEVEQCGLIIITAGAAQKPGESRLDLVQRNTRIYSGFFPLLSERNPDAAFMIVTNPVDVMTRVALKLSGLPARQVFGSGTVLDTARFRNLISQFFNILPRHVHTYVIGEHGDSEVLVWSRAMIGPFHISEYAEQRDLSLTPEVAERIEQDVRQAAYRIIERKGATHFAIGLATVRIAECLSLSQDSVLTLSRRMEGSYRLQNVCLSIPTLVSRHGAHTHFELDLSANERSALLRSAEIVDEVYQSLGLGD